jgi:hypothetical protein
MLKIVMFWRLSSLKMGSISGSAWVDEDQHLAASRARDGDVA